MKHFSDPCQNAQLKETNCNKFILDCINKCLCLVQIEAFWRAQFFFWQAKNNTTVSWVHAWRRFHSLSIKKTSAGSGSSPRSPGVQFSLNRRHGWIRKTWQTAVFLLVGKGTDIQIGNLFQVALGWFRLVWVGLGWFKDHQESAIAAFFVFHLMPSTWCWSPDFSCLRKLADLIGLRDPSVTSPQKGHSLAIF